MKKLRPLLCLVTFSLCLGLQAQKNIVLNIDNQSPESLSLSEVQNITFLEGKIVFNKKSDATVEYDLSVLKSILFVDDTTSAVRIIKNDANLLIYPVPATDKVNMSISLQDDSQLTAQIFAISGKIVARKYFQGISGNNLFSMDIANLKSGIYILALKTKNQYYSEKIIIK